MCDLAVLVTAGEPLEPVPREDALPRPRRERGLHRQRHLERVVVAVVGQAHGQVKVVQGQVAS
jgi:hypothetical protein